MEQDKYIFTNKMALGNYLINRVFNKVFKTSFNDILCCYKVLNKNELKALDIESDRFSIETELMSKLVINKFFIKEVKVAYKARSFSEGKKIKSKMVFLLYLLSYCIKEYSSINLI